MSYQRWLASPYSLIQTWDWHCQNADSVGWTTWLTSASSKCLIMLGKILQTVLHSCMPLSLLWIHCFVYYQLCVCLVAQNVCSLFQWIHFGLYSASFLTTPYLLLIRRLVLMCILVSSELTLRYRAVICLSARVYVFARFTRHTVARCSTMYGWKGWTDIFRNVL